MNDADWQNGQIAANEFLYTTSFNNAMSVGPFARTCLASHLLGKVIDHRDKMRRPSDDTPLLPEALSLHQALLALQTALEQSESGNIFAGGSSPADVVAISICTCARLHLYHQYACNEPSGAGAHEYAALETDMQRICLDGIRSLVSTAAVNISKAGSDSVLVGNPLYHAAISCARFIREGSEPQMYPVLRSILHGLHHLAKRWKVGGKQD
jgi:hypothetical protein